jgi:hypothetical protein
MCKPDKHGLDNNGIPLALLSILTGDIKGGDVIPGTISGLNGYTKQ